jgi:NAD(P)-dependent dehydrogenase (short-subunit alcohol dehydrogenase family)
MTRRLPFRRTHPSALANRGRQERLVSPPQQYVAHAKCCRWMKDILGRVAFVTGAAQGVGLGLARELARSGAHVVLADVQEEPVKRAAAEVAAFGVRSLAVTVDVSDRNSLMAAAERVRSEFGKLHILCNNAGVITPPKPISETTESEWAWTLGVNLYGVINGVAAFLPLIREHGEGGHVVNTASIGGMQVRRGRDTGPYSVSKYGVVAFSESLSQELEGTNIGVSVLCPSAVNTAIFKSAGRRPDRFGGPLAGRDETHDGELRATGMSPDDVGKRVVAAIRADELFVFTHEHSRAWLAERFGRILAAFDSIENP